MSEDGVRLSVARRLSQLSGWQRLWLAVSILWVAAMAVQFAPFFQTEDQKLKIWADAVELSVLFDYAGKPGVSTEGLKRVQQGLTRAEYIEVLAKTYPGRNVAET